MNKPTYAKLLFVDSNVTRWHANLARGSEITGDIYLRRLGAFCNKHNVTPNGLVSLNVKQIQEMLLDFVTENEKNFAGSYIKSTMKAVKSWLGFNDVQITRAIKIKGVDDTPTLRRERVPTRRELQRILLSASKQSRVAVVLMAHAGLRGESLGDYKGTDGLTLNDFPELETGTKNVKFTKTPTMIVVRPNLSKTRKQYLTFLGEEACGYIRDYLDQRLRDGELLTGRSPVIRPRFANKKSFIRTSNFGDMVRVAMRRAGFRWRPYALRCFFDSQLLLAESKGLVTRDYRAFWMGHVGDVENHYTVNKGRLTTEMIEDMRNAYRRSESFLSTTVQEVSGETIKLEFKKQLLAVAGFTEDEIGKRDLANITDEELHSMVRQKLLGVMETNGARQRVVAATDIERYLSEGWEYVASIPDEKAVIKIPF